MSASYYVGDGQTYSTIQLAIDAIPGNLSGQGRQRVLVYAKAAGYADGPIDIWTGFSNGSATDYIDVGAMVPHYGCIDQGILLDLSAAGASYGVHMRTGADYTRFHGFRIVFTTDLDVDGVSAIIFYSITGCKIYGNILLETINTNNRIIGGIYGSASCPDLWIYNNIVLKVAPTPVDGSASYYCSGIAGYPTASTDHPVIIANNVCLPATDVNRGAAFSWPNNNYYKFYNNYGGNCRSGAAFDQWGESDPYGAFDYNVSHDSSAGTHSGTGNLVNKAAADQFKDVTPGDEDLRLKMTADCLRPGQDNSTLFNTDIRGADRTYWATGAFEPEIESDKVFSTTYRTYIMDFMFGNTAFPVPTTMWLGLSSTDPTTDGSGITEPTDASYARQEIPNDTDNWEDAVLADLYDNLACYKRNKNHIFFPQATEDWEPMRYWFLADADESGNMIAYGVIPAPGRYVLNGDIPLIREGDLYMRLTNLDGEPPS